MNDDLMEARVNGPDAANSANIARINDAVKTNAEELTKISNAVRKPWYKSATGWFAFLAMLAAIVGVVSTYL